MKINELFLEITNQCQQNCIHCSTASDIDSKDRLSFQKIVDIIQQSVKLGINHISLSGGEPFLHSHFMYICKYIKTKNIPFTIYSCGTCNGKSIDIDTLNAIKDCGCDKVIYSLHGDEITQNKIAKNKNSYRNVIQSILNTKDVIPTEIHFVLMKQNVNDFQFVIDFAKRMNINVSVLRLVVQGRCKKEYELSLAMYKQFYNRYKDNNIRFGAPWNLITKDNKSCTATVNKILVQADGSVIPCEAFKWINDKPNIYTDTIEKIFTNSDLFTTVRQQITYTKSETECCCGQRLLKSQVNQRQNLQKRGN